MSSMSRKPGSMLLLLVSLLAAFGVLAFLMLDRYRYYDYKDAACTSGASFLRANLIGSFDGMEPTVRGNPYYLRMEVSSSLVKEVGEVGLNDIVLISVSSGKTITLGALKKYENTERDVTEQTVVYVARSLDIPYDDFMMSGHIAAGDSDVKSELFFSCTFKRDFWSEWRVRWLDKIMSV